MDELQIIKDATIAALLGGIIGFERETSRKPAGLRTYIFLSTTACLLVNFGELFIDKYSGYPGVQIDPVRTIEAIVSAVGFIAGGMLIKSKESGNVKNLTTAALCLFAAAIGLSVALQQYILALFLTLFSLAITIILYRFEKKMPDMIAK